MKAEGWRANKSCGGALSLGADPPPVGDGWLHIAVLMAIAIAVIGASLAMRTVITDLPVDEAGADPAKLICRSWDEK